MFEGEGFDCDNHSGFLESSFFPEFAQNSKLDYTNFRAVLTQLNGSYQFEKQQNNYMHLHANIKLSTQFN